MGCCKDLMCLTTISFSTMGIFAGNVAFCISLSFAVTKFSWVGYGFLVLSSLWNLYILKLLYSRGNNIAETVFDQIFKCLLSCLGVMVLLAISFTLITRYNYYERWPKYPEERDSRRSSLLIHKMGLVLLVTAIPMMYLCRCRKLIEDKQMIYKVIFDFIDIYETADLLSLGAPSCTESKDRHTYYIEPRVNCTESPYAALRENGSIEIAIQVLCSFSFLMFVLLLLRIFEENNKNRKMTKYFRLARLLQDVSFFLIRTSVWIMYGFRTDQFVFLVKNIVSGSLISLEFCKSYKSDH